MDKIKNTITIQMSLNGHPKVDDNMDFNVQVYFTLFKILTVWNVHGKTFHNG